MQQPVSHPLSYDAAYLVSLLLVFLFFLVIIGEVKAGHKRRQELARQLKEIDEHRDDVSEKEEGPY